MFQPIWYPPEIERYTCRPTRPYRPLSPLQKIMIWFAALLASWLMGLGVVKLSLVLYTVLGRLI